MKVLLVTFSENADHQDITFGMFEALLQANSPKCDVWVMAPNRPKVNVANHPHVHLVSCPHTPSIEAKTFDFNTLFSILRWLKKNDFDVVFFETLHVWNLPIMLLNRKRTRIYQMIHDLIPHEGDKNEKGVYLMNKIVCKLADYIVICNKKYTITATEMYHVPLSRIKHTDLWKRFPEYTAPTYQKNVLFFGRINPYKGIGNLLSIVKACPEICFQVVGRVDPSVRELADRLSHYPNVVLKSEYVSDSDMKRAFVQSDWVILPYNSATQSGVVIDAYRFSRPVIAFDVGAVSEQVDDGNSGFLIQAGDTSAFSEKLKYAVSLDKKDYDRMSVAAFDFGKAKYASEGAAEKFLRIITE